MKFYPLLATIFLFSLLGCDKEEDEPLPVKTPDEVVKEQLTAELAAESDLSGFMAAFEDLEMEAADVDGGITIFAPSDTDDSGGRLAGGAETQAITPEELKGHIVEGLIQAAGLEDGDELTTLNGKLLLVSVNGEEVRVNGVLITAKNLATNEAYVVHKVEKILDHPVGPEEPASVTVTVFNSVKWSPEKPKGEPEAGVTVAFYSSRGDYSAGIALFSAETDVNGKVVFPDAESGKIYYIVATKGDLTSVFHRSAETINGEFMGFLPAGIFQSQEEVDGSFAVQSGAAPGNFRWTDLNADGVINGDDSTPVPYTEAKPVFSDTPVEVIIGYENNAQMTVRSGEDALQKLQASRVLLNTFHKNLVMMDGILSDDVDCTNNPEWCVLDNYNFLSFEVWFLKAWEDGYANIGQLNLLLRDVPGLTFAEKNSVLAEARVMRAYIYLQLLTYFGDIPITDGLKLESNVMRSSRNEVLAFIQQELTTAIESLPNSPGENRSILTADATKGLLARAHLLNGNFAEAAVISDGIIQSAQYALVDTAVEVFATKTNAEIMWDFSFSQSAEFSAYFFDRTFCPALRLAEVYLISAEAELEMANLNAATDYINVIRSRNGLGTLGTGLSMEELRIELRATWKVEMKREGNRFANLVRWQAAEAVLAPKGFDVYRHTLLPVPQMYIDLYPNMFQNPGY